MTDKLLPCPFCGGMDVNLRQHLATNMSWVSCGECGLEAPSETGWTDDIAIEYWNTRAPSPETKTVGLIKRYDEHPDGGGMREDELGAFVRFETVEHLSGRIAKLEDVLRNFTASRDISYVEALKIARVALGDYRPHPSPEAREGGE